MHVSGQRKEDANLSCYLPAAEYFTVFLISDTRNFFQHIPHTITQGSSVISPSYSSSTHIIPALFTIHNTYQWNLPFSFQLSPAITWNSCHSWGHSTEKNQTTVYSCSEGSDSTAQWNGHFTTQLGQSNSYLTKRQVLLSENPPFLSVPAPAIASVLPNQLQEASNKKEINPHATRSRC